MDPATLAVLENHGSYAGRRVSFFRVFDPVRAAERAIQVRAFDDLEAHPELVLGSGHVERDGAVVLTRSGAAAAPANEPARWRADRAEHADDEQFVFPSATS